MNDPRGSVWRKWDLHVHTPASVLNNNFAGSTVEEKWTGYIKTLNGIQDTSAIALTDYFSIDGYKKVRAYVDANPAQLSNIQLILPNVELRILPVTSE